MKYTLRKEDLNTLDYLCDLDLKDIVESSETLEDLEETLRERIAEEEVIYYHNAIKMLEEEDNSLQESTELAKDMGYSMEDINSELLATIILQERMIEEIPLLIELLEN